MRSMLLSLSLLVGCNYGLVDHDQPVAADTAEPAPADDGSVDVTEVPDTGSNAGTNDTGTAPTADTIVCYWDEDRDGHGNAGVSGTFEGDVCPEGYATVGDDFCEDIAEAYTESDCAAARTASTDHDGDGVTIGAGDCDDNDASVTTNCEGDTAEEEIDADEDGFNAEDDCNDSNDDVNPDAEEVDNNGIDDNCNGLVDYDVCYWDADNDGYGNGSDELGTFDVEGGCGTNWATNGDDWCEDNASAHTESDCE